MGGFLEKQILPARSCQLYQELDMDQIQYTTHGKIPYTIIMNNSQTDNYMICFHGNGENMGEFSIFVRALMGELKTNAMLIEYPGYGIYHDQQPTAKLIKEQSLIAYNQLKEQYKLTNKNTYILGRSIGSGPAFYLASQTDIAGLIAISSFRSISEIVKDKVYYGAFLAKQISDQLYNESEIPNINCPIALIHGGNDYVISYLHSVELSKIKNKKNQLPQYKLIPSMGHNDIYLFTETICKFIKETFTNL